MASFQFLPNMLKMLMFLLLAAWILIWILRPTQSWKKSWHLVEDWASATFLGGYGFTLLVYCFPLLAVAALGFIYLHLSTKKEVIRKKGHLMINFTNPLIITSPVGILSGCEIVVATCFVLFLLWTYYINVVSDFKKLTPYQSLHLDTFHLKLMRLGIRVGSLNEVCIVLLLLPILRGMSILRTIGIQFEASVRYHIWIGNTLILFSLLHGITIMSVWAANGALSKQIIQWQTTGRVNIAGAISLVSGVIIWLTSFQRLRRHNFQLFYISHHLYIIFILFFLIHAGDRHFYLVLAGVLLFALDKFLRILQSRKETYLISANILPCKALQLSLPKRPDTFYTPTSIIFMKIPSISRFQWHPFSIISSCSMTNDKILLLLKCQGQWTNELYNKLNSMYNGSSGHAKSMAVAVEGPCGPASSPYQRYSSLIMVAGGSGITPFLSIIQDVAANDQMNNNATKMHLIYAVKRLEDLSMLALVSGLVLKQVAHGDLKLHLFVTQEQGPPISTTETLQDISQFKTILFEKPSSKATIQSSQGLLWKAMIILLAFIILTSSLIVLNHIFVHTKDRASERKIPSWIFNLLFISSFLITITSFIVIVLVSQGKKSVNDKQVPSDDKTEGSDLGLAKSNATFGDNQINFGKRPNIIDLLSELHIQRGESEVGVFVCGPQSLQESVALFCKSSQIKSNQKTDKASFIFHSINFSL